MQQDAQERIKQIQELLSRALRDLRSGKITVQEGHAIANQVQRELAELQMEEAAYVAPRAA